VNDENRRSSLVDIGGLRERGDSAAPGDQPENGQGSLRSVVQSERHQERLEESEAGRPLVQEGVALSSRNWRVVELLHSGLKNCEIARAIGCTESAIKNSVVRIFDALGLWNRIELALWYERRLFEAGVA
jgi:DNA-binding NarL/FixJ family response regulator